ncbi:MAG: PSD1 and planctomycete cytochrome C domain-containing protein [Planctomycetaceae bacterium]
MPHGNPHRVPPSRPGVIILIAVAAVVLVCETTLAAAQESDSVVFERDVFPILQRSCVECHGAKKQEGELRLDASPQDLPNGVLVAGVPEKSELIRRILLPDSDEQHMPATGKSLTPLEIRTLQTWVAQGAVWPANFVPPKHWAYVAPVKPSVPTAIDDWCRTPIDHFVLQHLKAHHLTPAAQADPATLIRRVTLDLTGLPPTPEEVEAFIRDPSDENYVKLVDGLLSRPQFGERWARPWLDLARYADSHGFQRDDLREIWPYRDWVIRALNQDMPFDQFTVEQLAGDLLPNATEDQKIATGFHRCAMTNVEAGSIPEETRAEQLIDRVNTTATVWLGTTLECAQCHDHKYDPFSMEDYYGLLAYFNNTAIEADRSNPKQPSSIVFLGPSMEISSPAKNAERSRLESRVRQKESELSAQRELLNQDLDKWLSNQAGSGTSQAEEVLHPLSFRSQGSTDQYEILDDHSILLVGTDPPAKDLYELTTECHLSQIQAFRLEALTHESLPGNGPGRGDPVRPNFVLHEFAVAVDSNASEPNAESPFNALPFSTAKADFSQTKWDVNGAIDGKTGTGWAIAPQFGKSHFATLILKEPVIAATDGKPERDRVTRFRFRLEQNFGNARTLGRFRITALESATVGKQKSLPEKLLQLVGRPATEWSPEQRREILDLRAAEDAETLRLSREIDRLRAEIKKLTPDSTLVMREETIRPAAVFERGDYRKPGKPVTPKVPGELHLPKDGPPSRLTLARWLVDRDNPLVARVTVNRWWAELFGRGLVGTPEDFGIKGEPPTHPELLDWLSVEFMDHNWSMKHVLRTIVISSVYRQSSNTSPKQLERDDLNLHLARGSRFRMDAEMIRDNALAVSGLLNLKQGGPPIRPPQPEGLWAKVGGVQYDYEVSAPGERHRRGIYVVIKRSAPNPTLNTFDAPGRLTCSAKRARTNTPLQALSLLNDPVFSECAHAMAARILADSSAHAPEDRLTLALTLAVGRSPSRQELATLTQLLNDQRSSFQQRPEDSQAIAKEGGWKEPSTSSDYAAWVSVCRVLLNLHETITRP